MEKGKLGICFAVIIALLSATIYFLISSSAKDYTDPNISVEQSNLEFYNVLINSGYSKDYETWEKENSNGYIEYRLVDLNIEFGSQDEWIRVYSLDSLILAHSWYESFVDGTMGIEYEQYYTVTFIDDNTILDTKVVEENAFVNAPQVSPKEGKLFAGWDYNLENAIESKTTINTVWENASYTITFVTSSNDYFPLQEVSYEEEITLPIPSKSGYKFIGWYNGNVEVVDGKFLNTSNITLYARWEALSYNITFDTNGGNYLNTISVTSSSTVELPQPTKAGSRFAGWYIDGTYVSNTFIFNFDNDIVLTASWTSSDAYFLSFNSNGAGDFEPLEVKKDFQYSLPVPTLLGYEFDGWYYNGSKLDDKNDVWMYDTDATAVAKWTIIEYKITYTLSGGINHSDNPATYTVETFGLLNYGTKENWSQNGWTINGVNYTEFYFDNTTGDLAITFKWTYKYYDIYYIVDGVETQTNDLSSYSVLAFSNSYYFRYYTTDTFMVQGWYMDEACTISFTHLSSYTLTLLDQDILEEVGIVLYGQSIDLTTPTYYANSPTNIECEYFNFGYYPTSVVANQNLISILHNVTDKNEHGYIEYNGIQYVYLRATPWNPGTDSWTITQKFSNNQYISSSGYYYYQVEPIRWRVIRDSETSEVFMTTEYIHGQTTYNNEQSYDEFENKINSNDWATSTIRRFLEEEFSSIAFSNDEYSQIQSTQRTALDGSVTEDKLFFFSCDELSDPNKGFSESVSVADDYRVAILTDYSRGRGCYATSVNHISSYWASPKPNSDVYIYYGGSTVNGATTNTSSAGYRPVMKLSAFN